MSKPAQKRRLAMIVPGHNEENVIASTLESLLELVNAADIYVVDDGSTDDTAMIARTKVSNVLSLSPNVGKATAVNMLIETFNLANRYEYILPMDADTRVTRDFLAHALPVLDEDVDHKIACVVGKVVGQSHNWVTTYRLWEYEVTQRIHKAAQSAERAITVSPGCSTVYRADIYNKVKVPTGTLTEDMDLTFLIHRMKLGRVIYCDKARVITQDPRTLRDLMKQIDRWYTGFWQCVAKHNAPWGGQMLDFEVALQATEGLFNGLLVFSFLFLIPFALVKHPTILLVPLVFDILFFILPTFLLAIHQHRVWKIFMYLPHFYAARFLSCFVFFRSFLKVAFGFDRKMGWFKAKRYKVPVQGEPYGPAVVTN
jgi:cellulose synthase/poly-beta-1,6-N-acetylglucosamine synthase-like glycosyltransferase